MDRVIRKIYMGKIHYMGELKKAELQQRRSENLYQGVAEDAPSYSNTALSPQAGDKGRSIQDHIFFSKAVHNLNKH